MDGFIVKIRLEEENREFKIKRMWLVKDKKTSLKVRFIQIERNKKRVVEKCIRVW